MATGDLVTADWQAEYNGVALGDGTPFLIAQIDGLLDLPEVRSADKVRLRRNGLTAGDDFTGGRAITVTLEVAQTGTTSFNDAVDQLARLTAPGGPERPLVLQIPGVAGGGKRWVYCKPRRRSLPIGREFFYGLTAATVEFFSTDPRIFAADQGSASTTLATAGAGLTFPATFPVTFGAAAIGGLLSVTNAGSFATSPTIRIDGPVSNPRIENVTAGRTLAFDITLDAGDYLLVDTEQRTVMLNGTTSRYNALASASVWFELEPGTSEVRFSAPLTSAATMLMTWRSAWV